MQRGSWSCRQVGGSRSGLQTSPGYALQTNPVYEPSAFPSAQLKNNRLHPRAELARDGLQNLGSLLCIGTSHYHPYPRRQRRQMLARIAWYMRDQSLMPNRDYLTSLWRSRSYVPNLHHTEKRISPEGPSTDQRRSSSPGNLDWCSRSRLEQVNHDRAGHRLWAWIVMPLIGCGMLRGQTAMQTLALRVDRPSR
jgi:hypothetical protein